MQMYLTGVILVEAFGLLELLSIFIDTFSARFQNFTNAGFFFDPITEKFYTHKQPSKTWAFYFADLIIFTPLLSWVSCVLLITSFIKKYSARSHLPDKVKELEYRLSTIVLQKEETIALINELNAFYYGVKDSNLGIAVQDNPERIISNKSVR